MQGRFPGGSASIVKKARKQSRTVEYIREVLHSVRRNFLDGMLRSGCEFRKLIPKRSLKRSIERESERNSVDHFRKVHSLVQW